MFRDNKLSVWDGLGLWLFSGISELKSPQTHEAVVISENQVLKRFHGALCQMTLIGVGAPKPLNRERKHNSLSEMSQYLVIKIPVESPLTVAIAWDHWPPETEIKRRLLNLCFLLTSSFDLRITELFAKIPKRLKQNCWVWPCPCRSVKAPIMRGRARPARHITLFQLTPDELTTKRFLSSWRQHRCSQTMEQWPQSATQQRWKAPVAGH